MARKKEQRQVEIMFEFDRLGYKKMERAYDILFSKLLIDSKKREELESISGEK